MPRHRPIIDAEKPIEYTRLQLWRWLANHFWVEDAHTREQKISSLYGLYEMHKRYYPLDNVMLAYLFEILERLICEPDFPGPKPRKFIALVQAQKQANPPAERWRPSGGGMLLSEVVASGCVSPRRTAHLKRWPGPRVYPGVFAGMTSAQAIKYLEANPQDFPKVALAYLLYWFKRKLTEIGNRQPTEKELAYWKRVALNNIRTYLHRHVTKDLLADFEQAIQVSEVRGR